MFAVNFLRIRVFLAKENNIAGKNTSVGHIATGKSPLFFQVVSQLDVSTLCISVFAVSAQESQPRVPPPGSLELQPSQSRRVEEQGRGFIVTCRMPDHVRGSNLRWTKGSTRTPITNTGGRSVGILSQLVNRLLYSGNLADCLSQAFWWIVQKRNRYPATSISNGSKGAGIHLFIHFSQHL